LYRQCIVLKEKLAADAPGSAWQQRRLAETVDLADPTFWDPTRAVAAATRAVKLAPVDGESWQILGIAHYRAGHWAEAAAALQKALNQRPGEGSDWFYLAMARWRLTEKDVARQWYAKATEWTEKHRPKDPYYRRLRAEAAELLDIKGEPTHVPDRPP